MTQKSRRYQDSTFFSSLPDKKKIIIRVSAVSKHITASLFSSHFLLLFLLHFWPPESGSRGKSGEQRKKKEEKLSLSPSGEPIVPSPPPSSLARRLRAGFGPLSCFEAAGQNLSSFSLFFLYYRIKVGLACCGQILMRPPWFRKKNIGLFICHGGLTPPRHSAPALLLVLVVITQIS